MKPLDGLHFLSLHPNPLPWEKENRLPSLGHTRDGVCHASVRKTRAWRRLSPLPAAVAPKRRFGAPRRREGEGQGEGKRRFDSHSVSVIQGTLQYASTRPPPASCQCQDGNDAAKIKD